MLCEDCAKPKCEKCGKDLGCSCQCHKGVLMWHGTVPCCRCYPMTISWTVSGASGDPQTSTINIPGIFNSVTQ